MRFLYILRLVEGTKTWILRLEMSVRNRLVSTQWSFIYGGPEYDNRRLSVANFMLDISVAQN